MTDSDILTRFEAMDRRIAALTTRVWTLERASATPRGRSATEVPSQGGAGASACQPAVLQPPAPAAQPVTPPTPPAQPPAGRPEGLPHYTPAPAFAAAAPERRSSADWETLLGGNWLNKIGAFVLVVGIALALGYSFSHMGPAGRDAVGLAAGLAMLGAGVFYERRPRYQTFARGLIGGGWAALYFTVYAMQALDSARVIDSPVAGALLLIAVAAAMIAHALRYRSEAVAGVACFSAFAALAITQVTALSVVALVPLAAALLYIARRFRWRNLTLLGIIATYAVCALRGDPASPLWSSQAIFAVYWLLFETFDIADPGPWLMPLNAAGFLLFSSMKWNAADPRHLWAFLAVAAIAYAVSGALRARRHPDAEPLSGGWHGPATLTAALAAAALLRRLDHQWLLLALLAEAELFFLCGLRLRAKYLRLIAVPLFALELVHLTAVEVTDLPVSAWAAVAALTALVLYANRALRAADTFYGYAAAAVAALVAGYEAPGREFGRGWSLLAAGPFLVGWRLRLADFRRQGYLLACLAAAGSLFTMPHPPLSVAIGAAVSYAAALCALWSAEDRFPEAERSALFDIASTAGAALAAILLRALLPPAWTGPAWAAEALLIVECSRVRWTRLGDFGGADDRISSSALAGHEQRWPAPPALRWQGYLLGTAALVHCWAVNLGSNETMLAAAIAIGCFYAAQLLSPRGREERLYYSLLATALLTGLLFYSVSGSVLTVAWGLEGLALLGAGFPLRDHVMRLSGLAMLLFCILKLFVYDLSFLDTLPRILSFIALGLILVGVSWIYTRFRERVQKYL